MDECHRIRSKTPNFTGTKTTCFSNSQLLTQEAVLLELACTASENQTFHQTDPKHAVWASTGTAGLHKRDKWILVRQDA